MLKHKLIKDVAIPMLSMNISLIGSCFRGLRLMSRSQFFLMFKCYNTLQVHQEMSIHPAMRPVRRMVQCEGIVSLGMPC